MAASDATPIPVKNQAYRVTFPILDADGDLVTGATGLDTEVSKDGGTFADCTNEATEIATSSGMYYLDLTATEMNADTVALIVKTTSSGAKTTPIVLYPRADGLDYKVDVTHWNGTAVATPATAGRPSVDVISIGNTTQTAADVGVLPTRIPGNLTITSGGVTLAGVVHGGDFSSVAGITLGNVSHGGTAASLTLSAATIGTSTSGVPGVTISGGNATQGALDIVSFTGAPLALRSGGGNVTVNGSGNLAISGTLSAGANGLPWPAAWDAEVQSECDDALTAFWTSPATLVDLVWDEATSGHQSAGTTGKALTDAGSAGDPWATDIQAGAYSGNQAGAIVYDNLDATISSRGIYDGGDITGNLSGSVGSVSGAVGSVTGNVAGSVEGNVVGTVAGVTPATAGNVTALLTTQMTESYSADGVAPTLAQALFLIQQQLGDFAISGTTLTVKQLDGSTTAATFTLDDATTPTSVTRAT